MEILDLAKEYLILRKIQASIEKDQKDNSHQLIEKPNEKDRLTQTEQQLDKRSEANKARQDKLWDEIKGKAKELAIDQGRGVIELTQQGIVIAALATGTPNPDKILLDLLDTRPEEIEYAAELQADKERRQNRVAGRKAQGNSDPNNKDSDTSHDATEEAKKKLANEAMGAKVQVAQTGTEVDQQSATDKAKQMLLDQKLVEEVRKAEEVKKQVELRNQREQLQRERIR